MFWNGFLKHSDTPSLDAKYLEKLVPKRLRLRTFPRLVFPFMDECYGVVAYLGLGKSWHFVMRSGTSKLYNDSSDYRKITRFRTEHFRHFGDALVAMGGVGAFGL